MVDTLAERCLFLLGKLPIVLGLQLLQFLFDLLLIGNRPLRVQNGIMSRMGPGTHIICHVFLPDLVFVGNHRLILKADHGILGAVGNVDRYVGAVDTLNRIQLCIVLKKQCLVGIQEFLREAARKRFRKGACILLAFFRQQCIAVVKGRYRRAGAYIFVQRKHRGRRIAAPGMTEQEQLIFGELPFFFDEGQRMIQIHQRCTHAHRGITLGGISALAIIGKDSEAILHEVRDKRQVVIRAGMHAVADNDHFLCTAAGVEISLQLPRAAGKEKSGTL